MQRPSLLSLMQSGNLDVMAVSWHATDEAPITNSSDSDEQDECDYDSKKKPYVPRQFVVKMFGVMKDGVSASVTITDFLPYFYVRVEKGWGVTGGRRLCTWLSSERGNGWQVATARLVDRKDYVGFRNGDPAQFVQVKFTQQFAMRQLSKKLIEGSDVDLRSLGIPHRGSLNLYESNIDPLLRLMHHRKLSPAGWIRLPAGQWSVNEYGLTSTCQVDVQCSYKCLESLNIDEIAPLMIMSFDIECGSSHGDFPQAKKGFNKLAMELAQTYQHSGLCSKMQDEQSQVMLSCLRKAFGLDHSNSHACNYVSNVFTKQEGLPYQQRLHQVLPDVVKAVLQETRVTAKTEKSVIERVTNVLNSFFPAPRDRGLGLNRVWGSAVPDPSGALHGDPVIQIGVAIHINGDKSCCQRHVMTLGSCDAIEGTVVHEFETESALMLAFTSLVQSADPDVLIGYNQFGFDFAYLNGRSEELGISSSFGKLGRVKDATCGFKKQTLSSSALGDNEYRYFDITGRCQIDIMKVVSRDHKLDSFKLDAVAEHFMGMHKNDISPNDIFRLQLGSSSDRRTIAEYCVQDCALCNHLLMKLEILANNIAMANVCSVPLSFIFLRGQGIKVQSLVARRCLEEGFVIPHIKYNEDRSGSDGQEEGYEGAIVLEPETGLYLTEPVSVLDFASLYPSSMISGNLSHDSFVMDEKYAHLPGIEYEEVRYDVRDDKGEKIREEVCRFAKSKVGILPMILQDMLSARKTTRAKIKALTKEHGNGVDHTFMLAVLDGQQLAFKVTANSLYGQTGARTSPLFLKQIAACTTAIGRAMIMKAKAFLEIEHGARIIYGDTDSVFAVFPNKDAITGEVLKGQAALQASIAEGVRASASFRSHLPAPHDLEYEKTFFPFFLLSKKRYVGKKFEMNHEKSEVSSMGLVTKRRDNAPIVKTIYGGIIDILLEKQDVPEAERFLKRKLTQLVSGDLPMEELVVSKALKGFYKAPDSIAHYVLARRMGDRDPGSKPQVNDRIPYVYIVAPLKLLQGDRIEDPKYAKQQGIPVDTTHYVTNQVMKPVLQLMSLALEKLTGYNDDRSIKRGLQEVIDHGGNVVNYRENAVKKLLFDPILALKDVRELEKKRARIGASRDNVKNGQTELTKFFSFVDKK